MPLTEEQARLRSQDRPSTWGSNGPITKLDKGTNGWYIDTRGSGFFLSRSQLHGAKPPRLGDEIVTYLVRGSTIRGIDLRGEPLFYKTDAELDADRLEWIAKREVEQHATFAKERRKLDRQFSSLPDVFQRRISWFRAWNPDFRWKNEAYEMSVCIDAVKIAETMKTPAGVRRFQKMSYKRQHETVPGLYDGHSGNSFGAAINLAWLYLNEPLLVIAEHGALTPLVGCEDLDVFTLAHPMWLQR